MKSGAISILILISVLIFVVVVRGDKQQSVKKKPKDPQVHNKSLVKVKNCPPDFVPGVKNAKIKASDKTGVFRVKCVKGFVFSRRRKSWKFDCHKNKNKNNNNNNNNLPRCVKKPAKKNLVQFQSDDSTVVKLVEPATPRDWTGETGAGNPGTPGAATGDVDVVVLEGRHEDLDKGAYEAINQELEDYAEYDYEGEYDGGHDHDDNDDDDHNDDYGQYYDYDYSEGGKSNETSQDDDYEEEEYPVDHHERQEHQEEHPVDHHEHQEEHPVYHHHEEQEHQEERPVDHHEEQEHQEEGPVDHHEEQEHQEEHPVEHHEEGGQHQQEERPDDDHHEEQEHEEEYEDEYEEAAGEEYDDYDDDDDEEEGYDPDYEEQLLYRNYEILSDFYKKHFVDLRVLDTTCEPEQIPPPQIENGYVKQFLTAENVLLPGQHYHEVIYACDEGYRLSDTSLGHMFCQQQGWMGVQPYCETDPHAVVSEQHGVHGDIQGDSFRIGSIYSINSRQKHAIFLRKLFNYSIV